MGFTALFLQHCMNVASVLCFLPLTLGVDGTGWGAQFGPWTATDWVALFSLSTVAYMGSGIFMQVRRAGRCADAGMMWALREGRARGLQGPAPRLARAAPQRSSACRASEPQPRPCFLG